jgi:hypothetical protein
MANNSQKTNFWDIAGDIINAVLIFFLVFLIMGVTAWLVIRGQNLRTATECPECPQVKATEAVVSATKQPNPVTSDYVCNAVMVGGPVEVGGQCSFCTINYSKPGEVYIAGKEPIQYNAGAWVFQYNSTQNYDDFKDCINGQDFVTIPSEGYIPVWP